MRRAVRGVLGLALLALLLVAFAFTFLHTPPGRTAARVLLERWASGAAGGPLRVGQLDLRLWRGEASATALSLRLGGASIDAQAVAVAWSFAGGPAVRLVRPSIVVRDTGAPAAAVPATGLAAQPWRVLERLGALEIVEGRLELRDAAGEPWLVLRQVNAEMTKDDGRRTITARVSGATAGWPEGGLRVMPLSGEGRLALEGGRLVFDAARVTTGGSSMDLHGGLDRISPITATASARASFDGALVEALAPGSGIEGRLEADVAVEVRNDGLTGTLAATSPALAVQGVGPWAASGRGRFDGPRLVLESLEVRGYGGRLVAEGPVALLPSAGTDVRVRAEGFDVAALAAVFAGAEVPVAARASGSLRWATTGWDVDAAKGNGEVTLRALPRAAKPPAAPGLPLTGSGRVRIAGRRLALEGASVEAHGARATADAELAAGGTVRGSWSATLPLDSVDALLADLGSGMRLPRSYKGTFLAEGDVAGAVSNPEVGAAVRSDGLSAHGRPLALEGRTRYAAGRLALAPLVVRSGPGRATITGSVPLLAGAGEWDLRGEVESLDLAPALAMAGFKGEGPATGTLRLEGPRDAPRARAALDARIVLAGSGGPSGEPVAVTLAATSEGARVEVESVTAETAGGRIEGSGRFDAATRALEGKARASGLAWARLPLLPGSLRRLGGTLAADVSLGGTPEAPSGEAHATLVSATLDGSPLPDLALDTRADGRRLELGGRAGDAAFLKGSGDLEGDWPLRLEIDVAALPAQALFEALPAARDSDATLEARGTVVLDLALRDPGKLRYAGEGLAASGRAGRLEWSTDPFRVEGSGEEANVTGLRLTTQAIERTGAAARAEVAEEGEGLAARPAPAGGVLSVDGRVPFAEGRTFDLAVKGAFSLAAVEAAAPARQSGGRASLEAHVGGTLAAPDLGGTFGIAAGRVRIQDVRVSAVEVTGRFQGREALVDAASARVLGGRLLASGSLPLAPLDAGRSARLHVEATDVDLSRLAVPGPQRAADSPSFLVSVSGDLEATAPSLEGLSGEGQITRLESRTAEGTFGLVAPAPWRLADGRLVQESRPPRRTARDARGERRGRARRDSPGVGHPRRPLRPASRGPVPARHHAGRPCACRPPGGVGQVGRPARGPLLRGRGADDPGHAGLQRLPDKGRGAFSRRPRGDRRDRGRGRRQHRRVRRDELRPRPLRTGRDVDRGGARPGELPRGLPRPGHRGHPRGRRRRALPDLRPRRPDPVLLHGGVRRAPPVPGPARLPARRPARPRVDRRRPPAGDRRAVPRSAARPQQRGPDRRDGNGDGERHARRAGGHRPGEPPRWRADHRPPRARPGAGRADRAQRLPGGRPRR